MKRYSLYIHINKVNGKVYIGISKNPKSRWANGRGYKGCPHFWAAIQKYGWDNFLHIIIRTGLTEKEAKELEHQWIYLFRADDNRFGYNITKGGDGMDLGKNSYSKEYVQTYNKQYHNSFKEEHGMSASNYYLKTNPEYKKKHDEAMKTYSKEWYKKFVEEHGMSPRAWKKHHPKNEK